MDLKSAKCVVIITESAIKSDIIEFIAKAGAHGYTVDTICGRGERGIREDDALLGDYLRNIKFEIVTTDDIAEKIISGVVDTFFKNYAGIAYVYDVQVVRPTKFGYRAMPDGEKA